MLALHAYTRKTGFVIPHLHFVWIRFRWHIRCNFNLSFRVVHRVAARVLLLVATAHWWPFAFFLVPAVAVAATGRALDVALPVSEVRCRDRQSCAESTERRENALMEDRLNKSNRGEYSTPNRAEYSECIERLLLENEKSRTAVALAGATIAATFAGIVPLWALRQAWMLAHPTQYYTLPTMLFPPAAVAVAYGVARLVAAFVLSLYRS